MKISWLLKLSILLTLIAAPGKAQIIPDATLGNERSTLNQDLIEGGARRGGNLFHSFQEFNVKEAQSIYFANPSGVENILTRVTGNNISKIFGTLGVNGAANLFLINPNGINFGPNARLDIRGSFTATTADAIRLGARGVFSASNPESSVLLSVNPSSIFSNALRNYQGNIRVEGLLQVQPQENLTLIGDNLTLRGATLRGGEIELTAMGGDINLTQSSAIGREVEVNSNNLSLTTGSRIESSGEILINFQETLTVTGYSPEGLFSGILSTGGGNILVNPSNPQGEVEISNRGFIASVTENSKPGGSIALNVENLKLNSGGQILSVTETAGNGGDIVINATDSITIEGKSFDQPFADVEIYHLDNLEFRTDVNPDVEASGEIPYVSLEYNSGEITTGETVIKATYGQPNYYSFTIAEGGSEAIFDIDYGEENLGEGIPSNMDTRIYLFNAATGALIDTNDDSDPLTDGAGGSENKLDSYLKVNLNQPGTYILGVALFLSFVDENSNQAPIFGDTPIPGDTYTLQVSLENQGKSPALEFPDNPNFSARSGIMAVTRGEGKGGDITLNSEQLNLRDDSGVLNYSYGGTSGAININANSIELIDSRIENRPYGGGKGGNINIDTARLRQQNAWVATDLDYTTPIEAITGDINIQASELVEVLENSRIISGSFGNNQVGNIQIETTRFVVSGSRISPNAFELSQGGNLTIIASDSVELTDRTFIEVESYFSTGDAGELYIETGRLLLTGRSVIDASTERPENGGDGGNTTIIAREVELSEASELKTGTFGDGDAGNILIETDTLTISRGATLSTSTSGVGKAGDISIIATEAVNLDSFSLLETSSSSEGIAGQIIFNTEVLTLNNGATISTATRGTNSGGDIQINAQSIEINNAGINSAAELGSTGDSGEITIEATELNLNNGGRIQALTQAQGTAGDVTLNVNDSINISGISPAGSASGVITSSEASDSGAGGKITINGGVVTLAGRGFLNSRTLSNNPGGEIEINSDRLVLSGGGQIITSAKLGSSGKAGNITLNIDSSITITGSGAEFDPPDNPTVGTPFESEIVYDLQRKEFNTEPNPDVTEGLPYVTVERTETEIISDEEKLGDAANRFDYYLFGVSEGNSEGIFDIDYGNETNKPFTTDVDTDIFLFTLGGNFLTSNDDADPNNGAGGSVYDGDSYLTVTFTEPGLYVIGVAEETFFDNDNISTAGDNILISGERLDAGDTYTLHISLASPGNFSKDVQFSDLNPNLGVNSGLFAQTQGSGAGGDITVNTPNLGINEGVIDASSFATGTSGSITLNAEAMELTQATISAASLAGTGGNINLSIAEDSILTENTIISTRAGTVSSGGGDGGNINIDTGLLWLQDESSINANAFTGDGGKISITAETVLVSFPEAITASSTLGIDGVVEINSFDLNRSLVLDSEIQPQDPTDQIVSACQGTSGNAFVVTGKGGVATNPNQILTGQQIWRDRRDLSENTTTIEAKTEIIPANSWYRQANGTIVLTARPSCP